MFPTKLSQPQREGILDLLFAGMYADGAVKIVEGQRVFALLSPYGWESYQDPQEYSDTAISRARSASEDADRMSIYLTDVSARLADEDVKRLALALLARLIESDDSATESEAEFYQVAKTAFGVADA